jgi:hypothetical protein
MRHKLKWLLLGQNGVAPIQSDENGKMAGARAHGY